MIPTGRQIPLEHGDYPRRGHRARVASLRESVLAGPAVWSSVSGREELPVAYQGTVLAPWPNRIADGRYEFDGTSFQLASDRTGPAERPARAGDLVAVGGRRASTRPRSG